MLKTRRIGNMFRPYNFVTFLRPPKRVFFIERFKQRVAKVCKHCDLHFLRIKFHKYLIYNNIYIKILKYLLRDRKIRHGWTFPEKKKVKKKKRLVLRFCVLLPFLWLKSLFINTARSVQTLRPFCDLCDLQSFFENITERLSWI